MRNYYFKYLTKDDKEAELTIQANTYAEALWQLERTPDFKSVIEWDIVN